MLAIKGNDALVACKLPSLCRAEGPGGTMLALKGNIAPVLCVCCVAPLDAGWRESLSDGGSIRSAAVQRR